MTTLIFVAIATHDATAGYRATFPDLPDCEAAGADLAQLLANARDVVGAHLQRLADQGEEWPRPTGLDQAQAGGGAVLLVDVQVEDAPVRVNISIGEQLLKRVDAAAEARGATRSGFIADALRASLGATLGGGRARGASEFDVAARQIQEELTAVGRRINESLGPDSAFSRSMAEFDDRVLDTVRRAADGVSAAITRRRADPVRPANADTPVDFEAESAPPS